MKSMLAGLALTAGLGFAAAGAATVDVLKDYGTHGALPDVTPLYGSGGTMFDNHVEVLDRVDSNGNRFLDSLSFGSLISGTVNSIKLTLVYSSAPFSMGSFWGIPYVAEDWRVYATTNGGTSVSDRVQLGSPLNSTAQVSRSTTLFSGAVFAQAVQSGAFKFWFGDEGALPNEFNLYSAKLTVDYTPAAVPLPAGGLLLGAGLAALGLLRRRKSV